MTYFYYKNGNLHLQRTPDDPMITSFREALPGDVKRVSPSEINALTTSSLFAKNIRRSSTGKFLWCGPIWYDNHYAIRSPVEDYNNGEEVILNIHHQFDLATLNIGNFRVMMFESWFEGWLWYEVYYKSQGIPVVTHHAPARIYPYWALKNFEPLVQAIDPRAFHTQFRDIPFDEIQELRRELVAKQPWLLIEHTWETEVYKGESLRVFGFPNRATLELCGLPILTMDYSCAQVEGRDPYQVAQRDFGKIVDTLLTFADHYFEMIAYANSMKNNTEREEYFKAENFEPNNYQIRTMNSVTARNGITMASPEDNYWDWTIS